VSDMTLQQVSLLGVIICPDQELEQRFAVNSFTVASFSTIIERVGFDQWSSVERLIGGQNEDSMPKQFITCSNLG
jgi:hypothetical protein